MNKIQIILILLIIKMILRIISPKLKYHIMFIFCIFIINTSYSQEVNNKFLINDYINIEGGIGYYFYLAEGGESETILNSNFSIDYDKHIYKNHYLSLEFSEFLFSGMKLRWFNGLYKNIL